MSYRLGDIAEQIRSGNTMFRNYVAGAAEFMAAMKQSLTTVPKTMPQAFVIPVRGDANPNDQGDGYNALHWKYFAVVGCFDNRSEKRGQSPFDDQIDLAEEQIFSCILNWTPSWAERAIEIESDSLKLMNRARIWYSWEFRVGIRLSEDDGFQEDIDALENLARIDIEHDIDPVEGEPFETDAETRVEFDHS